MNSKLVTISITTRNTKKDEYDLFSEMTCSGMGAMTVLDENGNPVDIPQDLKNSLLAWAGYDIATE